MNKKESSRRETIKKIAEVAQREAIQDTKPLINPLKPIDMSGSHSDYMKRLREARQREEREKNSPDTSGKPTE